MIAPRGADKLDIRLGLQPRSDDPELVRHASAAVARHSRRGWRLDTAARIDNIDAIVALAMAVERADARPEPVRVVGWL